MIIAHYNNLYDYLQNTYRAFKAIICLMRRLLLSRRYQISCLDKYDPCIFLPKLQNQKMNILEKKLSKGGLLLSLSIRIFMQMTISKTLILMSWSCPIKLIRI